MTDHPPELVERIDPEPVSTGHGFTEGPVWRPDGRLLFTDDPVVYCLDVDSGELNVLRRSGAGSNGMTLDTQGRLVMCDGLHRRVTRMDDDGAVTPLAASCEGLPLNRPNDVVFRSDGMAYFTDPGAWPNHTPGARLFENFVYGVTPGGKVFRAAEFEYPNGLAFSPDEQALYVSNTRHHKHISAYDVGADGALGKRRVFAEMPQHGEPGVPDGMKVDVEGRVYCTGPGGVWMFEADGGFVGKIRMPELPANLAWGDADWSTLYVTARTSVYRVRLRTRGAAPAWAFSGSSGAAEPPSG